MVDRVSKAVDFAGGNTPAIQSASGGVAPARTEGTARSIYVEQGRMSSLGDLVGRSLVQVGQVAFDRATEDAYLNGAAQIGKIQSEAELDSNPITSMWTKAGYRDAAFKLNHAKEVTKLEEDMKTLREKDVEAFDKHMQEVRGRLMPQLDGMSAGARKLAVTQMANTQELAFNAYTRERSKYIIDVEGAANMADYQSKLSLVQSARANGNPQEYMNATSTLMTAVTGMYTNPRLPQDVRNNLVYEAAGQAITSGDSALWGALKELPYDSGDGSKAPLLDRLPYQMQTKLADQARQASQNSLSETKMQYLDGLAQMEASWQSGSGFDPNASKAYIDQGAKQGFIRAGEYNSLLQRMYVATDKVQGSNALIQNYQSSVISDTDLGGKTKKEVRDAWVAGMYRAGKTDDQVIDALIQNGTKVGNVESLESVGASIKPILQKMSLADTPLTPAENNRLSKVLTTMNTLKADNRQQAVTSLLAGMPEDQRVFLGTLSAKLAGGMLDDAAIRETSAQLRAGANMSEQDKLALYNNKANEDRKKVQELTAGGGVLGGLVRALPFGSDVKKQLVAQRSTGVVSEALLDEMRYLGVANPGATFDVRYDTALANIQNRLVPTGEFSMVMPRGVSVQQFFKVDATQSNERVGKAITNIATAIPETKDKVLYFNPGVDGRVHMSVYDKDRAEGGVNVQSYTFEAAQVQAELGKMDAKIAEKSAKVFGPGKLFTQGSASVQYNGMSSTPVEPSAMYKFRSNLVKNEGVRDTVYKDTQGNPTAGVGVANEFMPKPGPDGKISQQDINLSFAKASDAAATAAVKIQNQTGLQGDKWFYLVGELAYQSGPGFASLPQYQGLLSGIRTGNAQTAQAALQKTPAYKLSGPERKLHYERLLSSAMNN